MPIIIWKLSEALFKCARAYKSVHNAKLRFSPSKFPWRESKRQTNTNDSTEVVEVRVRTYKNVHNNVNHHLETFRGTISSTQPAPVT
jgi:hypothetical protein